VRFRRCFRADGSCTCAVVVRDDNNILGINACQLGRPPTFVKYLVDPLRPAGDIQISADGLTFVVSDVFRRLLSMLGWKVVAKTIHILGAPHGPVVSPFRLVHSRPHLLHFFYFSRFPFLVRFTYFLLLSIPIPFPFYQNSPTPFSGLRS